VTWLCCRATGTCKTSSYASVSREICRTRHGHRIGSSSGCVTKHTNAVRVRHILRGIGRGPPTKIQDFRHPSRVAHFCLLDARQVYGVGSPHFGIIFQTEYEHRRRPWRVQRLARRDEVGYGRNFDIRDQLEDWLTGEGLEEGCPLSVLRHCSCVPCQAGGGDPPGAIAAYGYAYVTVC
jgi:hypothetical protein